MKTTAKKRLTILAGLGLALLVTLPGLLSANENRGRGPKMAVLSGVGGWDIVPPAFTAQFLFVDADLNTHARHMPLVGALKLTGNGVIIDSKISADFNAELDPTFSGPLWGEVTMTAKVGGINTLIFEGRANGDLVGLVGAGKIKLIGRGPYLGATLDLTFVEIGPGNTDNYNWTGRLLHFPTR